MPVADYLEGLAFALPVYAAVGVAAAVLARGRGVVAFGLLYTAVLVAVHLVPGAVDLLAREVVLGLALLVAAGAVLFARRRRSTSSARSASTSRRTVLDPAWWPALGAAGVSAACALAFVWTFAGVPITGLDALTFHIPNVARWIQTGSLWQIDQFVPGQAHGYYPHNGDVVVLSAVLPWRNDAFVRFVDVPFLVLLGAAVYAIGVELRAPRPAALLSAALLVSLPIVVRPALVSALPDTILLATFAAGLLFLLRGDLVLAGIGLGLAFGTKWYGVSSVAALLLVWVIARRPAVRDVLRVGGLVALFGGFWLVRNWVEAGNPVFPVDVPLLFDAPPDPVRAFAGASVSDYLLDWSIVDTYLIPSWRFALSWGGLVFAAATVAALRFRPVRWLAVAAIVLAAVYAITPYTALGPPGKPVDAAVNVRYLMPALVLAAAVLAWLLGRLPRAWGLAASALLLLATVRTLTNAYDIGAGRVLVAAVAVAGLAAALLWVRGRARAAIAIGAVALAAIAGHQVQQEHNDDPSAAPGPVLSKVASAASGARIGLVNTWSNAGISPVRAAFGERLANEVEYVGPFVDGMLRRERSEAAFVARASRFDLIVVGRGAIPAPRVSEDDWLTRAGWTLAGEDGRLALYAAPAR